MEAETNEPVARREKQRARIAQDEREKDEGGIGARYLFEKPAGKGALVLAREIVKINVAEGKKGYKGEEEEKEEPCAGWRKARCDGWPSGGHGKEVWRERAGEARRKRKAENAG